jgi:hypothetical protein
MYSLMKNIKLLILFTGLGLIANTAFAQQSLNEFEFLIGIWKVENKESYEVWNRLSPVEFGGEVYKMIDTQRILKKRLP